jgi:2-enoate reductase
MLREIIRYYHIDCYTSSTLSEIREDGVRIKTGEGDRFIPADSVILSVGYDSYVPFPQEASADSRVHIIGDASKVGNLLSVIEQAYSLAYTL